MSAERMTPPLPDYEDLSYRDLEERVRSLSSERLRELIAYEQSHADRMEVLELLQDRLTRARDTDSGDGSAPP